MLKLVAILLNLLWTPLGYGAVPESFVDIKKIAPKVIVEARYHINHNFIGRPIKGYKANKCYLTKQAAHALKKVSRHLESLDYGLKVYDCYRPQMAVDDFVVWAKDLNDTKMKKEFYVEVPKNELFSRGYIAEKSGHSRGSTVDLTIVPKGHSQRAKLKNLVDCREKIGERYPDASIDMGTGYDCFSAMSHTMNPKINKMAHKNRLLLKEAMERFGFVNYEKEWWHYTLKEEPFTDQYFNFEVE
ncbi:MAG: D-alanyl-D-alanine dipeptidase [Zetaproteobacteria bacterium]|nr:D-alanyl-D-alanine dipeptidase [Pseudobdellovibrionaceae bacterium]